MQRKSAQVGIAVELYRLANVDVIHYALERLLREMPDADTIVIRVERIFGPDDSDGAGEVRGGPSPDSGDGMAASQVLLP